MTTIKKDFVAIVELLEANKNKKVDTILAQILEMCTSKNVMKSTVRKNDADEVTHIFCYYHKKWEPIATVPYGNKSNTASGLNTMCKEGVNSWTKQQRVFKATKAELTDKMLSGELTAEQAKDALTAAEQARDIIVAREDGQGEDE